MVENVLAVKPLIELKIHIPKEIYLSLFELSPCICCVTLSYLAELATWRFCNMAPMDFQFDFWSLLVGTEQEVGLSWKEGWAEF